MWRRNVIVTSQKLKTNYFRNGFGTDCSHYLFRHYLREVSRYFQEVSQYSLTLGSK